VLREGLSGTGLGLENHSPQRKGLLGPGILRHGLPNECETIHAGDQRPGASLRRGATLVHSLRAEKLHHNQDRVEYLEATALGEDGVAPTGRKVRIEADHFVVAASAIGSPGLLLRSRVPDPHERLGRRTFIHPVNANVARMPETVEAYYGAPSPSIPMNFWRDGVAGKPGFKLEVPPLHPVMAAAVLPDHGEAMAAQANDFPRIQSVIALLRDGFNEDSQGGTVTLRDDGSPQLHYPMSDSLWEGMRESWLRMAECQFAAGASAVRAVHMDSGYWNSWKEAREAIREPSRHTPGTTVYRPPDGRLRHGRRSPQQRREQLRGTPPPEQPFRPRRLDFPTSLGANPQLTVYALAARNSQRLADRLKGQT